MLRTQAVRVILLAVLAVCCGCTERGVEAPTPPEEKRPFDVKANYEKTEHRISMRDGVKLHTVVYSPREKSQSYPILLVRTPYSAGPYGPDEYREAAVLAPGEDFLRAGYIFVFQDGRGTYNSEGEWVNLQPVRSRDTATDETTDTYDTIEWLIRNLPGNNGRVGQWGISHPGWYTVMGMVQPHPALKAASPQATTFDAFIGDDDHRNGALYLTAVEWWHMMSIVSGPQRTELNGKRPEKIDFGTPWNYEFFLNAGPIDGLNKNHFGGQLAQIWNNLIEHPDYDEFWASRNVERHLGNIAIPVLNVAGWFDSPDPYGAIATYEAIEKHSPNNQSTLVVGPWRHGGWLRDDGSQLGDIRFGSKTSEYYQREIVFPFFEHHLRDAGKWSAAEAVVFETGGNRWHRFAEWPPKAAVNKNLYLGRDGTLSFDAPVQKGEAAHDSYVSDPLKPVPYTAEIRRDLGYEYMVGDQRYASTRPDVLVYRTDVLEEDITLAGPIAVELFVSTSGTDSDWFVKLIDVYPGDAPDHEEGPKAVPMGGYQMLVGVEVMRGKYRNSFAKPQPMEPGKVSPIRFSIWDKFHTFKKGHRIMVQVHSTWFPAIDRNPQVFTNIYRARPEDFRKATQKVYRSAQWPSQLVVPVMELNP